MPNDINFITKKEAFEILDTNYDYLLDRITLCQTSIQGGINANLKGNIDIVNSRIDELEKKMRIMQEIDFNFATIIGFILGPVIGHMIVDPLIQIGIDKFFRRMAVNRQLSQVISENPTRMFTKADISWSRSLLQQQYDLSGSDGKQKLNYLYGAITKHSVGGVINDSFQNMISFKLNYKREEQKIELNPKLTSKSEQIFGAFALLQGDLEAAKNNLTHWYAEAKTSIINIKDDPFPENEILKLLKDPLSDEEKQLSRNQFVQTIIRGTNIFLFVAYLGKADLGSIVNIETDGQVDPDTHERIEPPRITDSKYVRPQNIPKAFIDYLLTNFPTVGNSIIVQEILHKAQEYGTLSRLNGEMYLEGLQKRIDFYLNNIDADKTLSKGAVKPLSLYDRSVNNLIDWINKLRGEMEISTKNIISHLEELSEETK